MSDALERLKALSKRLDEKLKAKQKGISSTDGDIKDSKESIKVEKSYKDLYGVSEDDYESEEEMLLHKTLLSHLNIDDKDESIRSSNLLRLINLYIKLNMEKKVGDITNLFIYKAMNISGIGLKEEDFGEIREGKYVQVIAITYEPDKSGKKRAKNISLGYFGKAEALNLERKNEIIEFVLRWRYEKAFQNLVHYRQLLKRVGSKRNIF